MINETETMRYWRSIAYEVKRVNGGTFDVIENETEHRQFPTITPLMASDFKRVMTRHHVARNHREIAKAAVLIEYVFLMQQKWVSEIVTGHEKMLADMEAIKQEPITRNEKLYKMARYFYEE
jgi:hypothetical protein